MTKQERRASRADNYLETLAMVGDYPGMISGRAPRANREVGSSLIGVLKSVNNLKKAGKVVQLVHSVMATDGKSFTLTITNPAKTIEVIEKSPQTAPMLIPPKA